MRKLAFLLLAILASAVGVDPDVAQQLRGLPVDGDCGKCVQTQHLGNTVHQMEQTSNAGERTYTCSGGGGHPVHNCIDGDGYVYTPGMCGEEHGACAEGGLMEELVQQGLSADAAIALAQAKPRFASYSAPAGALTLRDCSGAVVAVLTVKRNSSFALASI